MATLDDATASADAVDEAVELLTARLDELAFRLEPPDPAEALSAAELDELFRLVLGACDARVHPLDLDPLDLLSIALDVSERLDHPGWQANVLWRRSRLHLERGELDAARADLQDGWALGDAAGAMQPWLARELAGLELRADSFRSALAFLDAAEAGLDLTEDSGAHALLLPTLFGDRGRLFQQIGNADQAAEWFARERAAAKDVSDPGVRASVHFNSARFALSQRRYGDALRDLTTLQERADEFRLNPANRAEVAHLLARASIDDFGSTSRSPALLAEARARAAGVLVDTALSPRIRLRFAVDLARCELDRGDRERAGAALAGAADDLKTLERNWSSAEVDLTRAYFNATHNRWLRERWKASRAAGDEATTSELEAQLAEHVHELEHSVTALLEAWDSVPPQPTGTGFLQYSTRANVVGELMHTKLLLGEDARGALDILMRAQLRGSLAVELGLRAPSVAQLQAGLDPQAGWLCYLTNVDEGHLFVIEQSGIEHLALGSVREFEALRRELVAAVLRRPQQDDAGRVTPLALRRAEAAAGRMAEVLLPPALAERLARWKTIDVIGLELSGPTPFETLPGPSGRPLDLTHALSQTLSLPLAVELRRRAEDAPGIPVAALQLLVLAAPPVSHVSATWPGLAELELSESDAQRLVRGFAPGHAALRRGDRAWLALDAPSAHVLTILAHGVYDPRRLPPAALVLAPHDDDPTGLFGASEVRALQRSGVVPRVVVLAGCGTRKGPLRRGEDGAGTLPGELFAAGSHTVLASHTDLDYDATLQLLESLHRRLAAGDTTSEALRHARAQLARQEGFAHPWFHASLTVAGAGNARPPQEAWPR